MYSSDKITKHWIPAVAGMTPGVSCRPHYRFWLCNGHEIRNPLLLRRTVPEGGPAARDCRIALTGIFPSNSQIVPVFLPPLDSHYLVIQNNVLLPKTDLDPADSPVRRFKPEHC